MMFKIKLMSVKIKRVWSKGLRSINLTLYYYLRSFKLKLYLNKNSNQTKFCSEASGFRLIETQLND